MISNFFAFLLVLALMFPNAIKFFHAFNLHEHTSCHETTTHIHKKNVDCSICDFHFSTFSVSIQNFDIVSISESKLAPLIGAVTKQQSEIFHRYYLRGPPELY